MSNDKQPTDGVDARTENPETIANTTAPAVAAEGLDLLRPSVAHRTFLQGLLSLGGAIGIALLVPVAILPVGLPVVLAVRGVHEVIGGRFGVALQ